MKLPEMNFDRWLMVALLVVIVISIAVDIWV